MNSFFAGVLFVFFVLSAVYTLSHIFKAASSAKTFEEDVLHNIAELQSEQSDIQKSLADLHCRIIACENYLDSEKDN